MQRTLLVYESRYGSTEKIIKNMALILGPCSYCKSAEFKEDYRNFDFFILGAPIYEENIEENMLRFIIKNAYWLKEKISVLFCTCLSKHGENYLHQVKSIIGSNLLVLKAIGGTIKINELSSHDYASIKSFYQYLNIPVKNVDKYDLNEIINFSLELKIIRDNLIKKVPVENLINEVEKFLKAHNTCVLSTGYGTRVRATPIEYIYDKRYIYIMTEGGEKFANILLNKKVSIAVYDDYENMSKLAGIQISGEVSLVEYMTEEYINAVEMKGLKIESIQRLPVIMNIIKIVLDKGEFLYSKFKNEGFEAKQIIKFR